MICFLCGTFLFVLAIKKSQTGTTDGSSSGTGGAIGGSVAVIVIVLVIIAFVVVRYSTSLCQSCKSI